LLLLAGIPTKTNKEIRDLIIQSSDKYAAPTAQYGYGIPNFSLALTRSVKDFDKNYFVPYPNPTSEIISVRFPKVLIKERLFLYRFRPKVLERQVSSPVDTFSLKSLSNGIYIYKIESEAFSKSGKIIKQ
jgi:hypothetical protein